MKSVLDHCAVVVDDLAGTIKLFEEVFGMQIRKTEMKDDTLFQIWFQEGIQLTQRTGVINAENPLVNHIGALVEDVDACLEKASTYGAKALPKGKNWIVFPFGLCVEVLPMDVPR